MSARRRPRGAAARRPVLRAALRLLGLTALVWVLCTAAVVLLLRWLPPPSSAFMLRAAVEALVEGDRDFRLHYSWTALEDIAPVAALAVVAAEDQRFPQHRGFDFEAIGRALEARRAGGRLRGASTLTQQVAKNLFLWPGRSWLRKALEAWFTLLVEALWEKRRILEVYLNIAEFGVGIYGVEAAARHYFKRPAARLSASQSARLAAVLPSPRSYSVLRPAPRERARAEWIRRQMRQLGGTAYLKGL